MLQKESNQGKDHDHAEEIELYGDPGIASYDAKVPKFLSFTYAILPIWGICALCYFWNGSNGWFDRGYWHELQIAANTTFPIENIYMVLEKKQLEEEKEQTLNFIKPSFSGPQPDNVN